MDFCVEIDYGIGVGFVFVEVMDVVGFMVVIFVVVCEYV